MNWSRRHPHRPPTRSHRGAPLALITTLVLVSSALAAGASVTRSDSDEAPIDLVPSSIADGANSADAGRLLDGDLGTTDASSWGNAADPWSEASYPMVATIDLGRPTEIDAIRIYAGEIPDPARARLRLDGSPSGIDGSFTPIATVTEPRYGAWSPASIDAPEPIRFLRLRFDSVAARFNVAELAIDGRTGGNDDGPDGLGSRIDGVTVADGDNSVDAARLIDRVEPPGTDDRSAWRNPSPWRSSAYPMTATFDLGGVQGLGGVSYFVGNISQGTARVRFEVSTSVSGEDFQPLATVETSHRWNAWREVELGGEPARRVRIRFDSIEERFNISEVAFHRRSGNPTTTTTVAGPTTSSPVTTTVTSTPPTTVTPTTVTPTTGGPTTTRPAGDGAQPKAGPPPDGVVRSHGFGNWPSDHLSQACRDLHDSYWVNGPLADPSLGPDHPENRAYHTWHPAITDHPGTGERCDFGHEHGHDPTWAPADVFELSSGHPAFGYVAETMGGHRHEDHVGHKVTVAHFRAAIGNGAGSEPMYDAGFECDWLSKIHQGSHSLDAFANHLHEYYLTLRCFDGLNDQGVVDNTVVGTRFSVKVMYTYGNPNEFVEDNCASDDPATTANETVFPASILTGPEGQRVMPAQQTTPIGNDSANNRGFTCASGVMWKDLSEIQQVDLWTQLIKIKDGDDDTVLTIQPYYIVKNPARIIAPYDTGAGEQPSQVIRTISLCYREDGGSRNLPFCAGAPASEPDWRSPTSPFNGSFRAVNFKSSHVANAGGQARFCTDAFGFSVDDPLPCDRGNVTQTVTPFDNHWNDGRYRWDGRSGNIQGSIWAEDPFGRRFTATDNGDGSYRPNGVGQEFIIDNRDPDDDRDGRPDGANLRGQN